MEAQAFTIDQPFHGAYEKFIEMTTQLSAMSKGDETHSEIEAYLETDGRELLRLLLQEHLDNQGCGRVAAAVRGSDGVVRSHKRDHMETGYKSVFGAVRVARTGYSQRGGASLFPRDAQLNLPAQGYSHRLQKRVAAKAAKMSFESVAGDIETETGVRIGVPVAGVQKTTIRTFTVEGEEKNEGLRPRIRWTKTPDFVHVYRGISSINRVFFLTSAVCPVRPTQGRKVFQRSQ